MVDGHRSAAIPPPPPRGAKGVQAPAEQRASQRTLLSGGAAKPGSARTLLVRSPSSVSMRGASMLGRSASGRELGAPPPGEDGPPPGVSDVDYKLAQMARSFQS
jgi:hypothetical protein